MDGGGPSLSLGLSSIGGTYSTMVDAIIRPPRYPFPHPHPLTSRLNIFFLVWRRWCRMRYTTEDLGPAKFRLGRRTFQRTDFQVRAPLPPPHVPALAGQWPSCQHARASHKGTSHTQRLQVT
jgi:hypothetical protein